MPIKCTYWEHTGEMTPFIEGVSSPMLRNTDTGEVVASRDLPVGAIWYASTDTQGYYRPGPDGKTLFVRTPGGDWCIDGRASNCTKPQDNEHYCWVRHGVPPVVTVDKKGNTCSAGGGSIAIGSYHGHLTNGFLTNV